MRQLIAAVYMSLDGVVEEPSWTMPYWSNECRRFKRDELFASDALLLGRVTYQGFAEAWPSAKDEDGFAERINALPKFVASTTLREADWNAKIIEADVAQEVARLKAQDGGNLLIYGSGDLLASLLPLDLIDELRLIICPVVVGQGKRLFAEGTQTKLKLLDTQTFEHGVIMLTYRLAPQD